MRSRMYLAPTPRERERRHALWLLCRGLSASGTAQALGRDAHTIGRWAAAFGEGGPPFSRGQALPGYSPDGGADEAIWGWAREEATGNLCLGTKALVKERVGNFLCGLSIRKDEVKGRCRTVLQSKAEGFLRESQPNHRCIANAHPTLALV